MSPKISVKQTTIDNPLYSDRAALAHQQPLFVSRLRLGCVRNQKLAYRDDTRAPARGGRGGQGCPANPTCILLHSPSPL